MARVVTLAARTSRTLRGADLLRAVVVTGCAAALILAKAPLPF
jgi:hypothetical protein